MVTLAAAGGTHAQEAPRLEPGLFATREQLERQLQEYEAATNSREYSGTFRAMANQDAELIRYRLKEGDFQVGDQISIQVTGHQAQSNTFTVSHGRILTIPEVGEVPLTGLLRSELRDHLTKHIGRYIRNPEVFVRSMIVLRVTGAVGAPGYITIEADSRITDVITKAGNLGPKPRIEKMKIMREGDEIWSGEPLQAAIGQGRTLDQLNLRQGDQIDIPDAGASSLGMEVLKALPYLIPLAYALSQIL
jgi:protein involved in polysaccharide export with SLBB domain